MKTVSAEVLEQGRLGGKRHLLKEGMTKWKLESYVHTALTFSK